MCTISDDWTELRCFDTVIIKAYNDAISASNERMSKVFEGLTLAEAFDRLEEYTVEQ